MNRCHRESWLNVYKYDFLYVYPETIPEKYLHLDTKTFFGKCKIISTQGPVPKLWIGFSYTCSEYYELYLNFDEL